MISLASSASARPATTVAELIDFLANRGQPALCQYLGAERIEISGRVLVNWATKTANLLAEHYPVLPQQVILVGPAHWKFLAIALGTLLCGTTPQWSAGSIEDTDETDFSAALLITEAQADELHDVTADPEELIQVDLETLATEFSGELDPFALDFATEAPAQPDQLMAPIIDGALPQARTSNLLLSPGVDDNQVSYTELIELALATWAGGRSVVISDAENHAQAVAQESPGLSASVR